MAKRVGVIGSGVVGKVLADGFLKHGYVVKIGSREPEKLADWQQRGGERASPAAWLRRRASATSWC